MTDDYRNNHYVTQWYQKKFMLSGEHEFFHLDLKPNIGYTKQGKRYEKRLLKRQGGKKSFVEKNLYLTKLSGVENAEIEKAFFGEIDSKGRVAVKYFEDFSHPIEAWHDSLENMLIFMSTQKLRTPKGLSFLSKKINSTSKDEILHAMVRLRQIHCAIWTEAVWQIADASNSETKFIISDHPVTVYNRQCGPSSNWCRNSSDPDIWLQGTHTIFPLSKDKILILTNLSWVRNPYQSAIGLRPNPNPFRDAIFKYTAVHILRHLSEQEVREINFIIKKRAFRYIAAGKEDWLYPEKYISKSDWHRFGGGYLLMPDPRAIHGGGEIFWGNSKKGSYGSIDAYGRRPWDQEYRKESKDNIEEKTLQWFQGEFAHLMGPFRRGLSMEFMALDPERDSDEMHEYYLGLRKKKKGN